MQAGLSKTDYPEDSIGTDIEPLGELPVKAEEETPMDAGPFAAAFLVNLVTFIGVLLMFGPLRRMMEKPRFRRWRFACLCLLPAPL